MKAGGERRRGFLLSGVSSWLGLLSTLGRLVTWLTVDNRKQWLDACPTCMLHIATNKSGVLDLPNCEKRGIECSCAVKHGYCHTERTAFPIHIFSQWLILFKSDSIWFHDWPVWIAEMPQQLMMIQDEEVRGVCRRLPQRWPRSAESKLHDCKFLIGLSVRLGENYPVRTYLDCFLKQ